MHTQTQPVPHGAPDQMNIYVLDIESEITGYGKHNRLTVFGDTWGEFVSIREDVRGLPISTEEDRMKVATGKQRQHPTGTRLTLVHREDDGDAIWYQYRIIRPAGSKHK